MTTPPEKIPLPDQSDYFRSAELADHEAQSTYGSISRYLFHKERAFRDDTQGVVRIVTRAGQIGRTLQPPESGSDRVVAVRLGAVGSLVIIEKFHHRVLFTRSIIDSLPYDMRSSDPETLLKQIKEMGEEGLDILGDHTVRLAERWQDWVTNNPGLFLNMMGVVALGARNAHIAYNNSAEENADRKAIEQDFANFDPDSPELNREIEGLLSGEVT